MGVGSRRPIAGQPPAKNDGEKQPSQVLKLLAELQNAQRKSRSSMSEDADVAAASPKQSSEDMMSMLINKNRKQGNVVATGNIQGQMQLPKQQVDDVDTEKKTNKKKNRRKRKSVAARMEQQGEDVATPEIVAPKQVQQSIPPPPVQPMATRVPKDVLEDLEFRFISNMHEADKKSKVRICFQLELAHWYYLDFYVENNAERKDCPSLKIREFSRQMFFNCKELKKYANHADDIINEWREYKSSVPTYGAILLDKTLTKVLLVQGFYAKKNSWGLPKGKVNQNEAPRDCAIREVREETGFDFSTVSTKEKKFQKFLNDTMIRHYVVLDVPMDYPFAPQTRKEIRDIRWFDIAELPTDRTETSSSHNFYTVIPFVPELQRYVRHEQERRAKIEATKWGPEAFEQLRAAIGAPLGFSSNKMPQRKQRSSMSTSSTATSEMPSMQGILFPGMDTTNAPNSSGGGGLTSDDIARLFENAEGRRGGRSSGGGSGGVLSTPPMPVSSIPTRFKQQPDMLRPMLPEISPNVAGIDTLGSLGLCTPIKPGVNPFPHLMGSQVTARTAFQLQDTQNCPPSSPTTRPLQTRGAGSNTTSDSSMNLVFHSPGEKIPVDQPLEPLVISNWPQRPAQLPGGNTPKRPSPHGCRRAINFDQLLQAHNVANVAALLSPQERTQTNNQGNQLLMGEQRTPVAQMLSNSGTPSSVQANWSMCQTDFEGSHPPVYPSAQNPQREAFEQPFEQPFSWRNMMFGGEQFNPPHSLWHGKPAPSVDQGSDVKAMLSLLSMPRTSTPPNAVSSPIGVGAQMPASVHSLFRPIQPQPVIPQPGTIARAEGPKRSSGISLSDNSAFTVIPKQMSLPKATSSPPVVPTLGSPGRLPPRSAPGRQVLATTRRFNASNSSTHGTPPKGRNLTPLSVTAAAALGAKAASASMGSPAASSIRTETSSLDACMQELSMIEKEQQAYANQTRRVDHGNGMQIGPRGLDFDIPLCDAWQRPFKLDVDAILGPPEIWQRAFVLHTVAPPIPKSPSELENIRHPSAYSDASGSEACSSCGQVYFA